MSQTLYLKPQTTIVAKEFLKDKPDLVKYKNVVNEEVSIVVEAIKVRINEVTQKGKER